MKRKLELTLPEVMEMIAVFLHKAGDIPDTVVNINTYWDFHNTNNSSVVFEWEEE